MAKRKTVTITIDEDLWRIAEALLPCSRSKFFENQLRTYLNSIDDIEKLEKDIIKERKSKFQKEYSEYLRQQIEEKNKRKQLQKQKELEEDLKLEKENQEYLRRQKEEMEREKSKKK